MIKVACQTIVYGNPVIKDNIEGILSNISENKYDGVEIGARHFYMDKPQYYIELFKKNKLELPAIHVGGDFLNRDSVNQQIEQIGETIKFAKKLSCKYLYLSGTFRQGKTEDDYLHEAKTYNEIGKRCNAEGLTLCYHNHDWEIINDMMGMNILLEAVDEKNMKLVPDVGWVTIGGGDPVKFLQDNLSRVEALHFKDFKGPREFTEIGTGIVDFESIYSYFKDKKKELWITAEQDVATDRPEDSSRINSEYIKGLIRRG